MTYVNNKQGEYDMKIGAACENEKISGHFGHCRNFMVFDVEDKKIVGSTSVANPGHDAGSPAKFLTKQGVSVVLCGSLGQGALDSFAEDGVEVVSGVTGDAQAAAEKNLSGELVSRNVLCQGHGHHGEGHHGEGHQHGHGCGGHGSC